LSDGAPGPSRRGVAAAGAACVGIAAIVAGQALVAHPQHLWFDVDPASDPNPFAGLAPSAGLFLDSLALALAAAALVAVRRGIDRVGAAVTLLAGAGMLPVAWHAVQGPEHAIRGLQWAAAIGGAAAIAVALRAMPAGRLRVVRAVVLGVVLASSVPMAVRGAVQRWQEHPATVAHYREHRAEILAARGWAEGSPQALTYERRLLQPEATAWFGMSNVAAGVLGAASLALGGCALALRRTRPAGALLFGSIACGMATVAFLNGSKGAVAATLAGAAFAAWCALRSPGAAARAAVALGLVAAAVLAVGVRGAVGERSDERSLLFRAHYAEAALRAVAERPVAGVGPAGFGDAYLRLRPDRSPEEVQSAHAMWADWSASLGVPGGLAWVGLAGLLLAIAARGSVDRGDAPGDGAAAWTRGPLVAAAATATAALAATLPELGTLDDRSLLLRVLASLLAASAAGAVVRASLVGGRIWSGALAGAAVALVVHAQVEMTLWWPGAAGWAAAVLAVAAVDPSALPRPTRASGMAAMAGAAMFLAPCVLGFGHADRARRAEQVVADAAAPLALLARARMGEDVPRTATLDQARMAAAAALAGDQDEPWLRRPALVAASLDQAASAAAGVPPDASEEVRCRRLRTALGLAATQWRADCPEQVASACAALAEALLALPGECIDRDWAEDFLRKAARRQVEANPRSVRGWTRLAEALARAGRADDSRAAARRALECDASYALDPLRRLPDPARARLEELAGGAVTSPAPTAPPR
jgi:hypothetical protein